MSLSKRTEPIETQARAYAARDKHGTVIDPRIVVHKPRRGDIHHLNKKLLTALWRWIPMRYRQGLEVIELRARTNEIVGYPYGCYDVRSKAIRLYSCPPLEWPVGPTAPDAFGVYKSCGARIEVRAGIQYICWANEKDAGRYFCAFILAHELGHHFMHQFKYKRKLPNMTSAHEAGANLHGLRLRGWRAYNAVSSRLEL